MMEQLAATMLFALLLDAIGLAAAAAGLPLSRRGMEHGYRVEADSSDGVD